MMAALSLFATAFAASPLGDGFEKVVTSRKGAESFFNELPGMIASLSNWLLGIVGVLCALAIVLGGYQYIVGALAGKEDGKETVIYALTGLVVALLAFVIVSTVAGVLG